MPKGVQVQVLSPVPYWDASIDTILAFLFFFSKEFNIRLFNTFANEVCSFESKLNIQKSKLSDSNPPCFLANKSTMTLILKISVIVNKKSLIVNGIIILQFMVVYDKIKKNICVFLGGIGDGY